MNVPDALLSDITGYCKANNLELNDYMVSALRQGHTVLKYGSVPRVNVAKPVVEEKPVVVEAPVEVIQELVVVPVVVQAPMAIQNKTYDIYQED